MSKSYFVHFCSTFEGWIGGWWRGVGGGAGAVGHLKGMCDILPQL